MFHKIWRIFKFSRIFKNFPEFLGRGKSSQTWENWTHHTSTYAQPTHLIFGTVKYIVSMCYYTKNHVRGLCVGGDMVSLFFSTLAALVKQCFTRTRIFIYIFLLSHWISLNWDIKKHSIKINKNRKMLRKIL